MTAALGTHIRITQHMEIEDETVVGIPEIEQSEDRHLSLSQITEAEAWSGGMFDKIEASRQGSSPAPEFQSYCLTQPTQWEA